MCVCVCVLMCYFLGLGSVSLFFCWGEGMVLLIYVVVVTFGAKCVFCRVMFDDLHEICVMCDLT